MELRLSFGRGEERLVPPPEGEGEGVRLTTSAPPGAWPATSAPPLYPPLPHSSEGSPLPTPSDAGQNELHKKTPKKQKTKQKKPRAICCSQFCSIFKTRARSSSICQSLPTPPPGKWGFFSEMFSWASGTDHTYPLERCYKRCHPRWTVERCHHYQRYTSLSLSCGTG